MRTSIGGAVLAIGLATLVLTGCGGGGGGSVSGPSGGSGSSTASVQGQLVRGSQSASREPVYVVVLRTALGVGLAEAAAGDPVVGATVTLTPSGGSTSVSTTTDSTGHFEFHGLLPGTYTLSVKLTNPGPAVPLDASSTSPITVGAGDLGVINGTVTQSTIPADVHVVAEAETADGILQNNAQLGHAMNIAQAAHVSLEDVINFRLAGHGWGEVAHHFNVSPGVIGLGRSNLSDASLDDARASHGNGKGKGKQKS